MTEQAKNKILVVDDEISVGHVLEAGLGRHGFVVRYEEHSTEALKTCLAFNPDLILLDVDMPIKDGGQVALELENHPALQHIPVIFLTSLVGKEQSGKRNASGEMLLSKPISLLDLAAKINAILHP